ncbi:hypothetical protein ABZU75_12920 [Streptosporangium sp. NPDC005286]|uniref:hypothetical protein n=1 Tax=Streptosporangium sp. NPDC005286 TaxID=3154463 RepID=UPI0033A1B09B
MGDGIESGEEGAGWARIGPWTVPWHLAWWFTAVLVALAAVHFVLDRERLGTPLTIFNLLALAFYFWAYGQWRRRFEPELASSDAQHWLVLLFALILALALWPIGSCGPPIGTLIPWFGDDPAECEGLSTRTTQLTLLGLLAIPLAVSTAVNRARG